jgi:ferric-dicitrate binding protein FerR (iron transport regulator)
VKNSQVIAVFIVLLVLFAGCQGKTPDSSGTTTPRDTKVTEDTSQASPAVEVADSTKAEDKAGNTKAAVKTEPPKQAEPASESIKESTRRELKGGEVGEVVFATGDVRIARNGSAIEDVPEGTGVENWDLVKTGESSSAELELRALKAPKTVIKVKENTAFTVDLNKVGSKNLTHVDMITGSITLKVQKLSKAQDLSVTSDTAMMGVRGTSFEVATVPTGDTLVTCSEGSVECLDKETEKKYYAKPGQVVEAVSGGTPKLVNAVASLGEYMDNWLEEKVRLLKQDALAQIKKYHKLYEKYSAEFEKSYAALSTANGILDKWIREDKEGKTGSNIEVMKEKKTVIGYLMKIQKSLFWMERVYFRLKKIQKYHDQGFGVGEIKPGLSTKDFFATLGNSDFEARLARVLFVHKLYAKRNDGSTPLDAFMGGLDASQSGDTTDDFFDSGDDFFNE